MVMAEFAQGGPLRQCKLSHFLCRTSERPWRRRRENFQRLNLA